MISFLVRPAKKPKTANLKLAREEKRPVRQLNYQIMCGYRISLGSGLNIHCFNPVPIFDYGFHSFDISPRNRSAEVGIVYTWSGNYQKV